MGRVAAFVERANHESFSALDFTPSKAFLSPEGRYLAVESALRKVGESSTYTYLILVVDVNTGQVVERRDTSDEVAAVLFH